MRRFVLLGTIWLAMIYSSAPAQCPDEKTLLNRIRNTPDTGDSLKIVLNEMLGYQATISNCSYRNSSIHVILLRKIAFDYSQLKKFREAAQYEGMAAKLIESNPNKHVVKEKDLIDIYLWQATFYKSLNESNDKMKAIDSSITVALRLKKYTSNGFLLALVEVVEHDFYIGDYNRCVEDAAETERLGMECARIAVDPMEQDQAKEIVSWSLGFHVRALLQLKEYHLAEDLINHKIEQYNKEGGLMDYMGMIYGQMGEIEMSRGNFDAALTFYKHSLDYDSKWENDLICKQTMKDIGYSIYFGHYRKLDKAKSWYAKALAYRIRDKEEADKDTMESLDIFTKMGELYIQEHSYESAMGYFQRAFNCIQPGFDEDSISVMPREKLLAIKNIHYLINLFIERGDAYLGKYLETKKSEDLRKSIHIFWRTDFLLEKIKAEHRDLESKLFWRKNARRMYDDAIEACYLAQDLDKAFYFSERARAVLLSDQLSEQMQLGGSDLHILAGLKKDIQFLERTIRQSDSSDKNFSALQNELLHKRFQLVHFEQSNKVNQQTESRPLEIAPSIVDQRILNDHQALLELFDGANAEYVLLLTRGQKYFIRLNKHEFDSLSQKYISFLSNEDIIQRDWTEFSNTSHSLYNLIFGQVGTSFDRIIISPDGAYFPFEALITDNKNLRSPVYFIQDHAVSYTYSARYLLSDFRGENAKPEGAFLGLAPIRFPASDSLAPLQGSDVSLKKEESFFNRTCALIGPDASRNNFMQQFSNYSVIQLYTHSSDTSDRQEPVIYFADSSLYLSDLIPETFPSTRLIILSACNTGRGKHYIGEGIFSFNRAFAALGIPASVINLWPVETKETYRLTELFHKYLALGQSSERALQSAKLEFIKNAGPSRAVPYFWAATIVAGKSEAIEFRPGISWKAWTILGLGIIFLAIFIWWLWIRLKKLLSFQPPYPYQASARFLS